LFPTAMSARRVQVLWCDQGFSRQGQSHLGNDTSICCLHGICDIIDARQASTSNRKGTRRFHSDTAKDVSRLVLSPASPSSSSSHNPNPRLFSLHPLLSLPLLSQGSGGVAVSMIHRSARPTPRRRGLLSSPSCSSSSAPFSPGSSSSASSRSSPPSSW